MFTPVDPKTSQNDLEKEVLEFWRREKIFKKVQELRKDGATFVFFEGPPTANGKPGIHHVEARAFKDLIPRYQTMRGRRVDRKAGWDTHGLPVELQVEKKLGLKNKKEIEAYGIAKFNAECKSDVWTFKGAWEELTERIGFWLDLDNPYITYENSYIESVWHVLKKAADKKDSLGRSLLYQGHKVVPYCTRCGTALSSHEVAQGYKSVVDNSVFVKFRISPDSAARHAGLSSILDSGGADASQNDIFILAWTTTPWTLPGNVALAVGMNIEYVVVKVGDERFIVAKDLINSVFSGHSGKDASSGRVQNPEAVDSGGADASQNNIQMSTTIRGADLIGLEYEPLFPGVIEDNSKAFRVYDADFVTTEDGTGVVHTAVMYGEDDYNLGVAVGLPTEHTVGEDGRFLEKVGHDLAGRYVKAAETEKILLESLESRGLLLKTVPYTHDYPFCWRCDTALLYYARSSWFIRMSELRDELTKRNNGINWEPKTIQQGRMGEWLANAKDWAISRERYWGTPLPFWQCEDGHLTVIDSIKKLSSTESHNQFFIMRHGESNNNVEEWDSSWPEKSPTHLTENGREQVRQTAEKLKTEGVDIVIASDLGRTKETAEIVAKITGAELYFDEQLREMDFGDINGKPYAEFNTYFASPEERLTKKCPNGESAEDVRARMVSAILCINKKYKDKRILIVTHGDPARALLCGLAGTSGAEMIAQKLPEKAVSHEFVVPNWPFNEKGEVDLHRPYIDEIEIKCDQCDKPAKRIKEVADVWFDSGSMPYAQWSYPQAKGSEAQFEAHYPADYISEAIDQTRGWFYTLLAIATLLDKEAPFKNVICLGHVLDEHGKKMSKSKGNIVEPWSLIEKYGADALRFYFYSVNAPGEPKLFVEKDVQTVQRKVLMLWQNVYSFFVMYANQAGWDYELRTTNYEPRNVLDTWILARLNQVIKIVTESLDAYDALTASRALTDFIDDLSTWYLRRSRSRFSETTEARDRESAFSTLHHVLVTLSKLMAPFAPFQSESTYLNLTGTSVHLADWPTFNSHFERGSGENPAGSLTNVRDDVDTGILADMKVVREIVSSGLDARMKAGVKIRQKLGALGVYDEFPTIIKNESIQSIICDELNVAILLPLSDDPVGWVEGNAGQYRVLLDPTITPELKLDGMQRELVRAIQDMRKKAGLSVQDKASVAWSSEDEEVQNLISGDILEDIQIATRSTVSQESVVEGQTFDLNGHSIEIALKKVE